MKKNLRTTKDRQEKIKKVAQVARAVIPENTTFAHWVSIDPGCKILCAAWAKKDLKPGCSIQSHNFNIRLSLDDHKSGKSTRKYKTRRILKLNRDENEWFLLRKEKIWRMIDECKRLNIRNFLQLSKIYNASEREKESFVSLSLNDKHITKVAKKLT